MSATTPWERFWVLRLRSASNRGLGPERRCDESGSAGASRREVPLGFSHLYSTYCFDVLYFCYSAKNTISFPMARRFAYIIRWYMINYGCVHRSSNMTSYQIRLIRLWRCTCIYHIWMARSLPLCHRGIRSLLQLTQQGFLLSPPTETYTRQFQICLESQYISSIHVDECALTLYTGSSSSSKTVLQATKSPSIFKTWRTMVGFLNDDQRFDIDFVLLNLGGELKTRWDKPDGSGIINVSAYFLPI